MSYEILIRDVPKKSLITFLKSKGFKKTKKGRSIWKNTYAKGDIAFHPQGDKYKEANSLALYGEMATEKNVERANQIAEQLSRKFKAKLDEYY